MVCLIVFGCSTCNPLDRFSHAHHLATRRFRCSTGSTDLADYRFSRFSASFAVEGVCTKLSNEEGVYALTELRPTDYQITLEYGFQKVQPTGRTLEVQDAVIALPAAN